MTPSLLGILNVTPDSFSDGGRFASVEDAVAAGLAMAEAGATGIDVGGESTRPGAERVDELEQCRRVVPVLAAMREALDDAGHADVWLSVDTTRASVAEAAAGAGADVINDVSAGRESGDEVFAVAAALGMGVCVMHMQGEPGTMQDAPAYGDVVPQVHRFLAERATAAEAAGVERGRVWIDPGIGFGKTLEHNLALLHALPELVQLGRLTQRPVLLGASRKRFIQGIDPSAAEPGQREPGSIAATLWAAQAGVAVVRVHDVAAHAQALAVHGAITKSDNSQTGTKQNG